MTDLTDAAVKALLDEFASDLLDHGFHKEGQLMRHHGKLARALLDARAENTRLRATVEKRNEEIVLERDISAGLSAKLHAIGFIEAPTEPGSFIGDIWFGHSIKRTMGTHRWTGSEWTALPSEMDAVLDLLATARAEIATLKGPTNG
jgi:hypothetical protein